MARSARCSIPHPKRARALEARAFGRHEIVAALEPDQRQLGIELHREPRAARKQGTNTRRLAEHAGEAQAEVGRRNEKGEALEEENGATTACSWPRFRRLRKEVERFPDGGGSSQKQATAFFAKDDE